jgi:hypothetical protein
VILNFQRRERRLRFEPPNSNVKGVIVRRVRDFVYGLESGMVLCESGISESGMVLCVDVEFGMVDAVVTESKDLRLFDWGKTRGTCLYSASIFANIRGVSSESRMVGT